MVVIKKFSSIKCSSHLSCGPGAASRTETTPQQPLFYHTLPPFHNPEKWHPRSFCKRTLIISSSWPIYLLLVTHHSPSTGATGYIGGDILYSITKAYPDYEYAVLVRGAKSSVVSAAHPKIRIVSGTLDDAAIIEEESAKADIVIGTRPLSRSISITH